MFDLVAFTNYPITNLVFNWFNLLIGLITLYIIYYQWKISYWSRNGIKGPKPLPIFGLGLKYFSKPIWQVESEFVREYGKIVGVYNGTQPGLIIADPELVKEICIKNFNIFPQSFQSPYLHPTERKFLALMWGQEWKRVRSLLSTAFTSGKLRKMSQALSFCISDSVDSLESFVATNDTIDLISFWGRCVIDGLGKIWFATDLNAHEEGNDRTYKVFNSFFDGNTVGDFIKILTPEWFIKFTKQGFTPASNLEYLTSLAVHVIENRKNMQNGSSKNYNDLLQFLLENEIKSETKPGNKEQLTAQEIISSVVIFFLAGFETSATLISWICWELANNPDIQEKLYREVAALDKVTYDSVINLRYLNSVIEETLRLHPPSGQIPRVCHQDYLIPGTCAVLPKNSNISISIYSIHMNPEFWPEPEIFNPDRFAPENKEFITPFTYLPFGVGPKFCIGMRFALIDVKLAIASILRKYEFVKNDKTTEKLEYSFPGIVLSVKSIKVGIKSRTTG